MRYKLPWGLASLQDSHRNRVGLHEDLPTDAASEPTLSKGNKIDKEHCSEFGLDTTAVIPSDGSHGRLHNPSCYMHVPKTQLGTITSRTAIQMFMSYHVTSFISPLSAVGTL